MYVQSLGRYLDHFLVELRLDLVQELDFEPLLVGIGNEPV